MHTITLSERAVAVLRFRGKGHRVKPDGRNLPAYQEIVSAGLMEPDGDDFRFTEGGREQWKEIVDRESERIERERYVIPERVALSDSARDLLRLCVEGKYPEGDELNRPAYRELVDANIMIPVGTFTKGDWVVFRFTFNGWERRFEFLDRATNRRDPAYLFQPSRIASAIFRARSLMGISVVGVCFKASTWFMPCRCSSYSWAMIESSLSRIRESSNSLPAASP